MRLPFHWDRCFASGRRPAVSAVLLAAIVVGSVGLPVWPEVEKDLSTPFPCQHHSCGCRDAATCWKSCCCLSKAQKLAWAAKNKVAVPDYVRADEVRIASKPARGKCCANGAACSSGPRQKVKSTDSANRRFVAIEDYHRCQTGAPLYLLLAQALPAPSGNSLPDAVAVTELVPAIQLFPAALSYRPPSPPPKG
jgi:hypothetical protein